MPVPYTFATSTSSIPLSQLDTNFSTAITIGNTAVQLGNTITQLNNVTLVDATVSSANVTTANVTTSLTLSYGTANSVVYLNGSKVATAGSALTFDGTNLGIGTSSPSGRLDAAIVGTARLIVGSSGTSENYYDANTQIWRNGAGSTEFMRLTSSGNLLLGTASTGADGLGISNLLNLTFPEGGGDSYTNLFRQASSAATVLANGYKRSATAGGFASSVGTSWAKTAIGLGVGTGAITFYADPAGTVANGTDVTPTERARITAAGDFIHQVNSTAPSLSTNSTMSFELTSNTSLKIVVRGTDGVTRSATLTLA